MQSSNDKRRSDLFFFCQKETSKQRKRVKRVLDEATLSNLFKKFDKNFPTSLDVGDIEPERTLSDRLGDLITTSKSRASSTLSNRRTSVATDKLKQSVKDEPTQDPNAYTDTRLQGLRFLTDDSIKELDKTLLNHVKFGLTPLLPAYIIHTWHSNWADLTIKVSYKNFPVWRTKTGYDAMVKQKKSERIGSVLGDSERRSSSINLSRKSKHSKPGHISTLSRLTSISELKTATDKSKNPNNNNASAFLNSSINLDAPTDRRQGSASQKSLTHISESPLTSSNIREKVRNEMSSRLTQTTYTQLGSGAGYLVNYQLSNFHYREKGWTVIAPSLEDSLKDDQKKTIAALKASLKSIEDTLSFNEKFGLNLPCRYRLYGDQRKDQLEKYKIASIRQKKSQFALSILRNEIPKALDLDQILNSIANPHQKPIGLGLPPRISNDRPTKSAAGIRSQFIPCGNDALAKQTNLTQQSPTVFNVQTNDGTNSVYYPNGQLAILSANVFGFYVDNVPVSLSTNANNLSHSINNNIQEPQSYIKAHNTERGLSWQNIKNSYTTLVFGVNETKKQRDLASPISAYTNLTNNKHQNQENNKPDSEKNNHSNNSGESKLLAFITSSGSCVCYRENGMPYFVCTEVGGSLCDKTGCIQHQWKWNELHLNQYDELFSNLRVQLNEFIQIEYRNPFNIKLKFDCHKEVINFNLGSVKENQPKLNDMINRTVSDLPMKSAPGNLKLIPTAKGATINTYKQQHNQNRKHSISFNNIPANGQRDARIDKLLEPTVSYREIPVMKDLYTVQKRIRALLEDWQHHCRLSLNILSPDQYIFPEDLNGNESRLNANHRDFHKIILHKRKSNSVLGYTPRSLKVEYHNQDLVKNDESNRSRSAAVVNRTRQLTKQHIDLIDRIKQFKLQITKGNGIVTSEFKNVMRKNNDPERKAAQEEALNTILKSFDSMSMVASTTQFLLLKPVPPCIDLNKIPSFYRQRTMPAITNTNCYDVSKPKRHQLFRNSSELLTKSSSHFDLKNNNKAVNSHYYSNEKLSMCCPALLHNRLAFNKNEVDCKCRRQTIPLINDVEYDTLLSLLPREQLVVIVIIDSKHRTNIENITTEIYGKYNKNRAQPCRESLKDDTRFFRYNITGAVIDSNHNQSLLVTRHNVSPGMVLIYQNSNLVFCDAIFNGYGYSEQDFHKQLKKSRNDARASKFLPNNFRFNNISNLTTEKRSFRSSLGGVGRNLNYSLSFSNSNTIEVQSS